MHTEITKLEMEIYELGIKLNKLRKDAEPKEVPNYQFQTLSGEVSLSELFGKQDKLILIHNMGQGCRYCTLWADGINGFLPHLETAASVYLVSKDDPETQQRMAHDRGWRFRMASHGGGKYLEEQCVSSEKKNAPGVVSYFKENGKIYRKNSSQFGPGDQFCSAWPLLSLIGENAESWTPQFHYWSRPQKMDDGGQNLN